MKTSRGFDQKISFAWLIVFMFLVSKGLFFAAATLGGLPWIRAKVDKAKDSDVWVDRLPQIHQTAVDMFVTPIRLTIGQKEKMARLGGSAWLRDRIDLARGPKGAKGK